MPSFERRYIADYMVQEFPQGGYGFNVPLGPVGSTAVESLGYEAAARLYRPYRPEIDAVKYNQDGLILLEAKIFKTADAIAKLLFYGGLVESTEELRPWWGKPVELRLVTPRMHGVLEEIAKLNGITVALFITSAAEAHAKKYERYWTPEYQEERARRKAIMAAVGLD